MRQVGFSSGLQVDNSEARARREEKGGNIDRQKKNEGKKRKKREEGVFWVGRTCVYVDWVWRSIGSNIPAMGADMDVHIQHPGCAREGKKG